jgi:predicted transcriptional regulator
MNKPSEQVQVFRLPDDLVDEVAKLADRLGETPQDIVIAAVDHFTRIPEERRKAVLMGTSIRRRS